MCQRSDNVFNEALGCLKEVNVVNRRKRADKARGSSSSSSSSGDENTDDIGAEFEHVASSSERPNVLIEECADDDNENHVFRLGIDTDLVLTKT